MRRAGSAIALLFICAVLTGCSREEPTVWSFECREWEYSDDYYANDGELLSWCAGNLPVLALTRDGNGDMPPEAMTAACDAFNAEIEHRQRLLAEEYKELEQLAIGRYADEGADGFIPCAQYIDIKDTRLTDALLCVRAEGYIDWGGELAFPFAETWSFDVKNGSFVTWKDLTERPDELRAEMASALSAELEENAERFFPDALKRADAMEDASVFFAVDGVHFIFPDCLIAPHSRTLPELTVPYERLAPYLNEYGAELLKSSNNE